jgi:hypothetical protein
VALPEFKSQSSSSYPVIVLADLLRFTLLNKNDSSSNSNATLGCGEIARRRMGLKREGKKGKGYP